VGLQKSAQSFNLNVEAVENPLAEFQSYDEQKTTSQNVL
jgi:hypothetical protein